MDFVCRESIINNKDDIVQTLWRHRGFNHFDQKWSVIGAAGFKPVDKAKDLQRQNLYTFFLCHEEVGDDGEIKIKTAGKLLDNVITLEGMFTTVLFSNIEVDKAANTHRYYFITNADGRVKARSKYGTFPTLTIPNDLGLVRAAIDAYNGGAV